MVTFEDKSVRCHFSFARGMKDQTSANQEQRQIFQSNPWQGLQEGLARCACQSFSYMPCLIAALRNSWGRALA